MDTAPPMVYLHGYKLYVTLPACVVAPSGGKTTSFDESFSMSLHLGTLYERGMRKKISNNILRLQMFHVMNMLMGSMSHT